MPICAVCVDDMLFCVWYVATRVVVNSHTYVNKVSNHRHCFYITHCMYCFKLVAPYVGILYLIGAVASMVHCTVCDDVMIICGKSVNELA
jgi:hypothetical protein